MMPPEFDRRRSLYAPFAVAVLVVAGCASPAVEPESEAIAVEPQPESKLEIKTKPEAFDPDAVREKIAKLPVRFASTQRREAMAEPDDESVVTAEQEQSLVDYKFPTVDLLLDGLLRPGGDHVVRRDVELESAVALPRLVEERVNEVLAVEDLVLPDGLLVEREVEIVEEPLRQLEASVREEPPVPDLQGMVFQDLVDSLEVAIGHGSCSGYRWSANTEPL